MQKKMVKNILSLLVAFLLAFSSAANVLASDVDVTSVVDISIPTNSVTLEPGQSQTITINLSVSGNQVGDATFQVYRDWTLENNVFTGSNPATFTVPPQSGGTTTPFTAQGTVTVPDDQTAGTFTLTVGAFGITNSNEKGAKLGAGKSSTFTVMVVEPSVPADTTPPVITTPGNLTEEATGPEGASVHFEATAHDDVDGDVTVTAVPASGSVFALGTTTVTLTATDISGNTATATFNVTVVDTTPPDLTLPANVSVHATSSNGALVTYNPAIAKDSVDKDVEITYSQDSGTWFPLGTTEVKVTATDDSGNKVSGTFTVTVTYDFDGFFQPVDMGKVNVAKAGSSIPIKFRLGGDMGLDIMSPGHPRAVTVILDEELASDSIETVTAGSSRLTYDPVADQYTYVWKTDKRWSGMSKKFIIKLADGTEHYALFTFK